VVKGDKETRACIQGRETMTDLSRGISISQFVVSGAEIHRLPQLALLFLPCLLKYMKRHTGVELRGKKHK